MADATGTPSGYAAANIVNFIRSFGQHKVDNRVQDVERNYMPDAADALDKIRQVTALDPAQGLGLLSGRQAYLKQQADTQASADSAHQDEVGKIIGYTHGMGGDPMKVLDSLQPGTSGFSPEGIAQARALLTANPNLVQSTDPDVWKSMNTDHVVGQGATLTHGITPVFHQGATPKVNVVGSDAAGRQLVITPTDPTPTGPVGAQAPAAAEPSAIAAGATPAPAAQGNYIANGQDPYDAHIAPIEGGTNPDGSFRTSSKGAVGPGQVMPKTGPEAAAAAGLPWDPVKFASDPDYNRALGKAYYAKQLVNAKGNEPMAAAMYNAGPGRVARFTGQGLNSRAQALPAETQAYVRKFAPGLFGGAANAPGSAPAAGGSSVAFSQPAISKSVRAATPQEIKAAGYPDGTAGQVDPTGKFVNLKTPTGAAAGKKGDPVTAFRNALDGIDSLQGQLTDLQTDPERTSIEGLAGRAFQYGTAGTGYRAKLAKLNASKMVELAKGLAGTGTFSRGVTNMEAQQLPKTLAAIEPGMSHADIDNQFNAGHTQLTNSRQALISDAVRQGIATVMKNGSVIAKGETYNGHVYLGGPGGSPNSWKAQ